MISASNHSQLEFRRWFSKGVKLARRHKLSIAQLVKLLMVSWFYLFHNNHCQTYYLGPFCFGRRKKKKKCGPTSFRFIRVCFTELGCAITPVQHRLFGNSQSYDPITHFLDHKQFSVSSSVLKFTDGNLNS